MTLRDEMHTPVDPGRDMYRPDQGFPGAGAGGHPHRQGGADHALRPGHPRDRALRPGGLGHRRRPAQELPRSGTEGPVPCQPPLRPSRLRGAATRWSSFPATPATPKKPTPPTGRPLKRKAKILCISSNGMTEKLAKRAPDSFDHDPGRPPSPRRAGIFLLPAPDRAQPARVHQETNPARSRRRSRCSSEKSALYANPDRGREPGAAARLGVCADASASSIPPPNGSTRSTPAGAVRWRKTQRRSVFGHVLPEMNHNELVGWKVLKEPDAARCR